MREFFIIESDDLGVYIQKVDRFHLLMVIDSECIVH